MQFTISRSVLYHTDRPYVVQKAPHNSSIIGKSYPTAVFTWSWSSASHNVIATTQAQCMRIYDLQKNGRTNTAGGFVNSIRRDTAVVTECKLYVRQSQLWFSSLASLWIAFYKWTWMRMSWTLHIKLDEVVVELQICLHARLFCCVDIWTLYSQWDIIESSAVLVFAEWQR